MLNDGRSLHLPSYPLFLEAITPLELPFSPSELHGMMCGYLCAGAIREGESYLRALMANIAEKDKRRGTLALFGVYAVSQQQIMNFNFEFQLLLPDDDEPLLDRAKSFSEWCEGFAQGISIAGVRAEQLQEEEAKEALQHLIEFADMDYESLHVEEEDERAFLEITEYARMAVLHIYSDLEASKFHDGDTQTAH